MAIVHMQKVAVIAHRDMRDAIIDKLHDEGVIEIAESTKETHANHIELDYEAAEVTFAIETLSELADKQIIAACQKVPSKEDVLSAAAHTPVRHIVDQLHELEKSDTELEGRLQEVRQKKEFLAAWRVLSYTLDAPVETKETIRLTGNMPETSVSLFQQALKEHLPQTVVEQAGTQDGIMSLAVTVRTIHAGRLEEIATTYGWTRIDLPKYAQTANEVYEQAEMEEKRLEKQKAENMHARIQLAQELPKLKQVGLFMEWHAQKQEAREAMTHTHGTVTLFGWMPKKSIASLERSLSEVSSAIAILKVKPDEGEEPPILLKNAPWITPFESVTTLYGFPLPTEMDPTAALSLFFILYFSLCLTDGGYGLVLAAIFGTAIAVKRIKVSDSPLVWLLFMSGIMTVLVGIPFGGWFGLTAEQVPSFLTKQMPDGSLYFRGQIWNLSTSSGISFLQNASMVLGITHLFFGMFLAGFHKWVHGKRMQAFWQDFTPHLLLGSVLFYFFAPETLHSGAYWTLIASVVLLIWGKGYGSPWFIRPIMGFLGAANLAIGILSNSLSYLRILALGLVTGAIALAVNQVAIELGKLFPVWLSIPVIILIFAGGHLVSIALNTLGSFIHSGRLQFIEFFGQFFEGGGRPFAPFKRSTSS